LNTKDNSFGCEEGLLSKTQDFVFKNRLYSVTKVKEETGKPCWKEKIRTVDLRVLTWPHQLLLRLKLYFSFCETTNLNEEVNCTISSLQLGFPDRNGLFFKQFAWQTSLSICRKEDLLEHVSQDTPELIERPTWYIQITRGTFTEVRRLLLNFVSIVVLEI